MSINYASFFGTSDLTSDSIYAKDLTADNLKVTEKLTVNGDTLLNTATIYELNLPIGAQTDFILTSNEKGAASWKPPAEPILDGDIIGPAGSNIQNKKYIGNWDHSLDYSIGNQVSIGENLYVSLKSNIGFDPTTSTDEWSMIIRGISQANTNKLNNATSSLISSTIVMRNSDGNFDANLITANLKGNVTGNVTGNLNGNVTGNVTGNLNGNVTGNVTGNLNGNVTGNVTGNASTATLANNVITNANLSGDITSIGNVTTASSNIVKTTANQTLTNKNITGLSNTIEATAIRNAVWTVPFGGASLPVTDQVLSYNGSSAVWKTLPIVSGVSTSTPNTIMSRDANANTAVNDITLRKIIANDGSGYPILFAEDNNVRVGRGAGINLSTGTGNTYTGFSSGFLTTTGTRNTALGQEALYTGNPQNSTAIGFRAGYFASGSSNCTFIGCEADTPNTTQVGNSIAIGHGAKVSTNDTIQLGNVSIANVNTSGKINCNGVASTSNITCPNLTASGNINVSGNANVSGVLVANNGINTWNFNPPTGGGAWLSWNRGVGGAGRTAFMNQQGNGVGGWEWLNYNSSNALTSPNPVMTLDRDGKLTISDTISSKPSYWQQAIYLGTSTDVVLPNGTYTPVSFNGDLYSSAVGSPSGAGFTVTVAGAYKFTIAMLVSTGGSATNTVKLHLFVNGATATIRASFMTDASGFMHGSFIYPLNVGDVITWRATPNPTGFTAKFGAGQMDSFIMAERLN